MQRTLSRLTALAATAALALPLAAQELPGAGDQPPAFGVLPDAAPAEDAAPAQDDAPQEEPAQEAAPGLAPEIVPGPVPGQEPVDTLRETHGEWEVHCDPNRPSDCVMGQRGEDEDGNDVLEVRVLRLPEGAEVPAVMTVITPLGTLLPAGLGLQVDGGQIQRIQFLYCVPVGCIAEIPMQAQLVSQLQRGRTARLLVTAIAAPEDAVEVDMSLIGFTAAYNAVPASE